MRHPTLPPPLRLALASICPSAPIVDTPGPPAPVPFLTIPCGTCDGTGDVETVCCVAYDVCEPCHCPPRRRGYGRATCPGCHGTGRQTICPRCGSDRVGSNDDITPCCIDCYLNDEQA